MSFTIALALAGLMGAAGIGLAAAGAHAAPGAGLGNAANMLLFHAVAVMAGVALVDGGRLARPVGLLAIAGFIVGSALFAGDISARAFLGHRLFAFAAPAGGMMLIAAWLVIIVAALLGRR